MANTLRFKRGLVSTIPTALAGEPLFTTDTFDLYIGNGTTNTRFQKYIASGTTSQLLRGDGSLLTMPIVLTSPATGQVLKYNGTNWVNDSDAGITGSGANGQVAFFTGATTQSGSNNLFFDATNSRLGIGTNLPTTRLYITSQGANSTFDSGVATDARIEFRRAGTRIGYINWDSGVVTLQADSGNYLGLNAGGSERARLTTGGNFIINNASVDNGLRFQVTGDGYFSGSVGIGATPTEKLEVSASNVMVKINAATNSYAQLAFYENSSLKWNAYNDFNNDNYVLGNPTGPKFYLNQDGNLGLGVTPSAWATGVKAYEINSKGNALISGASTQSIITANAYFDGAWKYGTNGVASYYQQINAVHSWHNAISGTANAAITFTQAMTLDASGRLGIGLTAPTERLVVRSIGNSYANSAALSIENVTGANKTYFTNANGNLYITNNTTIDHLALFSNGNLSLSGTSDTGERLQVNGTMRVSGASTFGATLQITSASGTPTSGAGLELAGNTTTSSLTSFNRSLGTFLPMGFNALNYEFYTSSNLRFSIANSGAATFTSSGSFGNTLQIAGGTTAPTSGAGLELAGGSTTGAITSFNRNLGTYLPIVFNTLSYSFLTSGTEKFAIANSGAATFSSSVTAGGATTGRVIATPNTGNPNIEIFGGAGSNSAGGSAYYRLLDATNSRSWIGQIDANGDLDFWFQYGGTFYQPTTFTKEGAATFSSSVTALTGFFGGALGVANQRVANFKNINGNGYIEIQGSGTAAAQILSTLNGDFYVATGGTAGTFGTTRLLIDNTGAATFSSSVTANGGASGVGLYVSNNTNSRQIQLGYTSGAAYNYIQTYDGTNFHPLMLNNSIWIAANGNVGIGNTSPSYKLDVTGEARVSNAIAIGTTPDTNKPFKILKNINGTVGINFENTSTGSLAFSAIQMGTDVTGGTKFTNLVYSSSGVTASGVYQPDGTSLINNGSGGLNFLGNPIRMYTGGSNGSLRWDMTNDGFITQYTGTNPSTNATDGYRQYSADVVAGNAAPHFRTENGAVIKLYQETTGVGNSIISLGGGNAVLDDTTFDGYTLRQIVKALRNQGILA